MNSLEIRDTKILIKELHKCNSNLFGLIYSQNKWENEYGFTVEPNPSKEYKDAYDRGYDSYVVAIARERVEKKRLKKILDTKGHIPNKAERRKIRQDAAKNKRRKK